MLRKKALPLMACFSHFETAPSLGWRSYVYITNFLANSSISSRFFAFIAERIVTC